jgi:uncharacterized Tic20 family protein
MEARLVAEVGPEDRTYAIFNHLVFLLAPLPIIPQLIMWLIRKDHSVFLDDHGKEAVNFQITLCLFAAISGLLVIVGIGLIFLLLLPWFGIVCTIMAAVAAGRGEFFRYPMTIRLIQ